MEKKGKNIVFCTQEDSQQGTRYEMYSRCLVIHLSGDLDHHLAKDIREKSDYIIDRKKVKNIIFDFTDSTFMDSSGIGVIMGRYKRVIFTGGQVGVSNVAPSVDRILKMAGLYKIIKKYNSIKEALDELRVN